MQKYPRMFYAGREQEICGFSVEGMQCKFLFVILSEAKDLQKHKIKIYNTRFFAYRRRMTTRRGGTEINA